MKGFNRIISMAIAACMTLTMFAGAVSLDAANESETETLTGTTAVITEDGVVSQKFEYTIPADATKEEKKAIALQAAAEAAGVPSANPNARSDTYYMIASKSNFGIPSYQTNVIMCSSLRQSGGGISVYMEDIVGTSYIYASLYPASKNRVAVSRGEVTILFLKEEVSLTAGSSPNIYIYGDSDGIAGYVEAYHHVY